MEAEKIYNDEFVNETAKIRTYLIAVKNACEAITDQGEIRIKTYAAIEDGRQVVCTEVAEAVLADVE